MTTPERFAETHRTETHCQFPACPNPPKPARAPGQRSLYCADHTRVQALRERNRLARLREKEQAEQQAEQPVSEGIAAFAALLKRHEQLVLEMAEITATITDPAALAREIAEVQRAAEHRIAEAEAARDAAEREAARARAERDEARELRDEALAVIDEVEQREAEAVEARAAAAQAVEEATSTLHEYEREMGVARDAQVRAESERDAARTEAARVSAEATQLRTAMENQRLSHQAKLDDLHAKHERSLLELAGGPPVPQQGRRANGRRPEKEAGR